MKRSLVLFAMVVVAALFVVTSMSASQQASADHKAHTPSSEVSTTVAVHQKVHTASKGKISVHHVAVIPEAHGIALLNATALKKELSKEVKGPYGEKDVLGGMMSGGY
jgi:archaellin